MAGAINQEGDDHFKVSFPFSGQQHEVHSLRSAEEAGLIALALAMKAAEELQQALDALPPAPGTSRPSFCPPLTATLDVPGLAPTSFRQLVEELQACVDWRNDSRAHYGGYGYGEPNSLHTLLPGAASLGCAGAARQLLLIDPTAATSAWGSRMPSNAAHEAAMAGHPAVLRVLLAAAPEAALDTVEDQNEGMYEWTLMHSVAVGGSAEVVQVVLRAAPDSARAINSWGRTPLHEAVRARQAGTVRALLQAAPDTAMAEDGGGLLALHWAALPPPEEHAGLGARDAEVVSLLLAAAPDTAFARMHTETQPCILLSTRTCLRPSRCC